MDNKKFVGYYIVGATNREEAQRGAGLLLWTQTRPNAIKRFLNNLLLNIQWVDKEDYTPLLSKEPKSSDTKVEFPKHRTYRKKKVDETK
jgi:hypothetical protein